MSRRSSRAAGIAVAALLFAGIGCVLLRDAESPADPPIVEDRPHGTIEVAPAAATVEKAPPARPALSPAASRGLRWLSEKQGSHGGFGQNDGEEPDVANTAIAAIALVRAGSTPSSGPHREAVARAVEFVRSSVAASPDETPFVTERRGTQPQSKVGPYVDTSLSCLLLGEVDGKMPDEASQALVREALEKCVKKLESLQSADGSFNQGGWAPVLGSSFAYQALQAADGKGVAVDGERLAKAQEYFVGLSEPRTGLDVADSAGVQLYAASSAGMAAASGPEPKSSPVLARVANDLTNPEVLRGFGSMGGEEFVSFMMASTTLKTANEDGAVQWNARIREQLSGLQNADGSWAGHHCITGRVFCTAAAILTLLEAQ